MLESSNTEAENNVRKTIDAIQDNDAKTQLLKYLESHLINVDPSNEFMDWYFVNAEQYEDLINEIDKLPKKAC
jgi:hypothetical protein